MKNFSIGAGSPNSSHAFGNDRIVATEAFAQVNSTRLSTLAAMQLKYFEDAYPPFHVEFTDAGAGIANSNYTTGAGAQPVHARASAAWTRLANGLWASVAAGKLRSYYHEDGTYMGALFEQAAINQCLWNRDLTNAAWVKVGAATIAKDGTGMDGVANSCSTMTCGAANDTVMQTVVMANNTRQGAFWIKRLVGAGTVEITLDGGATWTNVTSTLSALYFRWCGKLQTLVNPTLGIRMGTVGDQIAVDMALVELNYNGNYECVETPIPTTVAAVTRQADALGAYDPANISDTEGTIFVETSSLFENNGGARIIVHTQAGGIGGAAYITGSVSNSRISLHDSTNAVTA